MANLLSMPGRIRLAAVGLAEFKYLSATHVQRGEKLQSRLDAVPRDPVDH